MSFKLGVKAFAKKMGRDVNEIKRLVAIDIFGKIITESPVIQGAKVEDDIYLSNGLPYAKRLENGWSRQAPTGMVRINVARFSSAIKQAVQGRLK